MNTSRTPYHFFLSQAGYSFDPKTETPMQGRIRCAQSLATAERRASEEGCSFVWEYDRLGDSSDFSDEVPSWPLWVCTLLDSEGQTVTSLGGIDFGRDGDPWDNAHRRVVEAELACELPD